MSRKLRSRHSDDTMDDDSDDKDSKRKSRNLSEKKRRDQFNVLVNELSSIVSTGGRKMDKSTILKSTISFLKNHNETAARSRVNEIQEDWKPTFLTIEEFTHLVLEAIDGFIIVFSVSGQIHYASESVTSLLGHLPNEILHMTIYNLASEEEQSNLYHLLLDQTEIEGQISFSCHLRRGGVDIKESSLFELVHFVGYFKSDEDLVHSENRYSGFSGEADTRLVFVGTGRIQTPQLIREMPLVDSSKSGFTSRHSLEWKFLFLDHRAPPIIGYLPFELLGTSGYDYYHVDDLDKVINCHEALMQKGEGTSCFYRFLTKGQQWIWLQTRFYITYDQWNSKPEFIVCTHRVISYVDVMKENRNEEPANSMTEFPNLGNGSRFSNKRSSIRHGDGSDCTSMSSYSLNSKQSAVTQQSGKSNTNQEETDSLPQAQQQSQSMQFLEPTQYMAAIPVQSVLANFSTPTVSPSIQSVENAGMSSAQNQIQIDLERKHAELQALIGKQQAELKRVSEQLLMAKLGILPQSQNSNASISFQSGTNSGTVSSTTANEQKQQPGSATSVIVPESISLPNPQQSLLYNSSNSNNLPK